MVNSDTSKKSFNPSTSLQDLTGKIAFVTGGNRGIGYETVKHLARKGATVYLGSRSEEAGKAAAEKLNNEIKELHKDVTESPGMGKVISTWCDISSPQNAKKTGEGLVEIVERLDIVVLNAAMLADYRMKNPSEILATNHFGNFVLIQALLPKLQSTAHAYGEARLITVSSLAHTFYPANNPNITFSSDSDFRQDYSTLFHNILGFKLYKKFKTAFSYYTVSKLCQLLTHIYIANSTSPSSTSQSTLTPTTAPIPNPTPNDSPENPTSTNSTPNPNSNLIVISVDPGAVNTFSHQTFLTRLFTPIINIFFDSPEIGSYNLLFASASPIISSNKDKYHGKFLTPVGKVVDMGKNVTLERARELVETTEDILLRLKNGEEIFPLVK